ncbi:uncharacterized protein LOC126970933 isoform X2 [Leptidea sinapis]|uniref:uncharacterized protein LOC126970933 isoform X2 n=1 Tax=Leptidea sinapis TaxID=189913 RepID=UPI00213E3D97|nr:uncharacterized protein LOC126970933 isoform X2 [Leptidea sinapis]
MLVFLLLIVQLGVTTIECKLDIKVIHNEYEKCTTTSGVEGVCVPEHFCASDHKIYPGGNAPDSFLRKLSDCTSSYHWCCEYPKTEPDTTTTEELGRGNDDTSSEEITSDKQKCVTVDGDFCPWCAILYKKPDPFTERDGLFCTGVVIGDNVVLTLGTCSKAAPEDIRVAVPESLNPFKSYKVQSRFVHEGYNTGTRQNDFAFVVLDENIVWPNNAYNGACLGLSTPLKGDCYAFAYINKKIHSNGAFVVAGLARRPCRQNTTLLGSIEKSSVWIKYTLNSLGMKLENYYEESQSNEDYY